MSMSYIPLSREGEKIIAFSSIFKSYRASGGKINISVVMLMAMGMKCKLTIAVFSLKINYSFYLLYLFLVSMFHHLVPSHIAVWMQETRGSLENKTMMHKKHYVYI